MNEVLAIEQRAAEMFACQETCLIALSKKRKQTCRCFAKGAPLDEALEDEAEYLYRVMNGFS